MRTLKFGVAFSLVLAASGIAGANEPDPSCRLPQSADKVLRKGQSFDAAVQAIGCNGKKLSTFTMLGSTTEIFEFLDSDLRVQMTFRDGKLQSFTERPHEPIQTGTLGASRAKPSAGNGSAASASTLNPIDQK